MDDKEYNNNFSGLTEHVRTVLGTAPGCHDFFHVERVLHNARLIASGEAGEADLRVVEIAALMHDIGRPAEMESRGRICHAEHGAASAVAILREYGFEDPALLEHIRSCIFKHRYRSGAAPETLEEKIVYDADKLDSIGAVGIGRAFHFAGRIGAKLHNTSAEALNSESYSQEDTAFREYLVKLRHVEGRMLTDAGKMIAARRSDFMHDFFSVLNEEVFGRGPASES